MTKIVVCKKKQCLGDIYLAALHGPTCKLGKQGCVFMILREAKAKGIRGGHSPLKIVVAPLFFPYAYPPTKHGLHVLPQDKALESAGVVDQALKIYLRNSKPSEFDCFNLSPNPRLPWKTGHPLSVVDFKETPFPKTETTGTTGVWVNRRLVGAAF